jgi:hypothetical protein
MDVEKFETTSGKSFSVHRDESDEIVMITPAEPLTELTENEIYDLYTYVDSDGEDE